MKVLKTASYKKAQTYKSDNDIANEFSGMVVNRVEVDPSRDSGWVEISFPNGEEHVGGGTKEVTDRWIKYKHNKKIALDNWYPDSVYMKIVEAIEDELETIFLQEAEQGSLEHQDYPESSFNRNEGTDPIRPNH